MAYFITPIFTYDRIFTVISIIIIIRLWFQHKFTYWSRRRVAGPKPVIPFGNIKDVIKKKEQFFQPYIDNYYKYKNLPYVGMYSFHCPVLLINDLEMAKHVLIKDFDNFQSRGTYAGGVGDRLAENLFNLFGKRWKSLRLKMTPTFTPGKLKTMYPIVEDIANKAMSYASVLYSNREVVNFSDFYSKYAMEIIGNIGFGVECNGFNNPKSDFHVLGHEYFDHKSLYW